MKKLFYLVAMLAMAAMVLVACGATDTGKFKDGTYEGVARGASSDIKVSVEVKAGKIDGIKILEHEETQNLIEAVMENTIPEIIEKQGTEGVEAISGASKSSSAVKEAVNQALEKAKK
ncbi:FMN-binding protein [Brevibacillus laterosporus]|uniref:FMN-binding protein n=2 Tax=Brevibacillus TaxID=55080 RepID=A0A0F6XZI4_BRELA|nr:MULTISPECIES: FMN-binding protein [Brevibacillus]AKF93831.1 FMN-binding protein [Brevibacillus laterosporus]MCR8984170.1 FMN-binding protein [Brevibacillus laterosporus]MCZ0829889.1 FMN-binding protein [Brevibacillus halotolerans]GIO01532.1 FMN-binding protein [Brevibacillus halotolerans]